MEIFLIFGIGEQGRRPKWIECDFFVVLLQQNFSCMTHKLRLFSFLLLIILKGATLSAQDTIAEKQLAGSSILRKPQIDFEVRSDVQLRQGMDSSWREYGFEGQYLNFSIQGDISSRFHYRIRQRLNKGINSASAFFAATDFAWLSYDITDRLSVTAGKQAIGMGGFEYDYAPIDVYWWSEFCNRLAVCYEMGLSLQYSVSGQSFLFQVTNSPFITSQSDGLFSYNLLWYGKIKNLSTIYSFNLVEYQRGKYVPYFNIGHRLTLEPLELELDFMNRTAPDRPVLFDDYTVVGQCRWALTSRWSLMIKGGLDRNKASKEVAVPAYTLVPAGTEYYYGLLGAEFFPLSDASVRIHAFVGMDNMKPKSIVVNAGATWRIHVL